MMFNPSGREDITYNDFLEVYKRTPDFSSIVGEADALAKDFETIEPNKKAISPEEFLKILNTPNTQSQGSR